MVRTLKDINWNQVYCFFEVARRMSMKDAAEILGVSKATISEQIKRLESLLGTKLFHRYPRKIELTEDGQSLYASAREVFEAGGRLLDTVSQNSIGGYTVRVGIQESASAAVAVDFVSQYWDLFASYGTVSTIREIHYDRLLDRLVQGEFDWIMSLDRPKGLRIAFEEIGQFDHLFCCSPRIYEKFKNPVDILRSIPLARSSWDRVLNDAVDDHLRLLGIFPEEIIETDHREFSIDLAQRGRCVAVFPKKTISKSSWGPTLASFQLGGPLSLKIYVAWMKNNERMVSIRRLKELLNMNAPPQESLDPDLQLKVNAVPKELLTDK